MFGVVEHADVPLSAIVIQDGFSEQERLAFFCSKEGIKTRSLIGVQVAFRGSGFSANLTVTVISVSNGRITTPASYFFNSGFELRPLET